MANIIPATARTMALLEAFAKEQRELSNSELAKLLSIADSSCSELLSTLQSLGYVMKSRKSRKFYPTHRLAEISQQIAQHDMFGKLAQEVAEQLGALTHESAFVGVLERGAVKVVAAQTSPLRLRYVLNIGERIALNASAMGKALLGSLPADEQRRELERRPLPAVTAKTRTDVDTLLKEIETQRQTGFYQSVDEGDTGVIALAVSGLLAEQPAAIAIAGPAPSMEKRIGQYVDALMSVKATYFDQPEN